MKEESGKCAKCGSSPTDDPTVMLHRFPQPNKINKSRCELWAKFCFPDDAWQSPEFQTNLYLEHVMLCDRHFKSTSFKRNIDEKKHELHSKEQDNSAGIIVVKNEPDEEIYIQESIDNINQNKSSPKKMCKNVDTPKKKQLKRRAEERSNISGSLMKTLYMESQEISQEDFYGSSDDLYINTTNYDQTDDCLLYGKLLTKKLRTYSVYERNLLIYKIDGLLLNNPPGFNTSVNLNKTDKKNIKKKASTRSTIELSHADKAPSSSSSKRKKIKKEPLSHLKTDSFEEVEIEILPTEEYNMATQVTSTSIPSISPVKITNDSPNKPIKVTSGIPNGPVKVTSCIPNKPVKVTSSNPKHPVKVKSSIHCQPFKVTSSIPSQPVKVISSIANQPVKIKSISSHVDIPKAMSASVPSHIPLEIIIPENKLATASQSQFVASSCPKGKIVIMKTKSSKYVPSSQPPILITVPTLPTAHIPDRKLKSEKLE